ncbi:hypothetical protein Bhyg_07415 [Pseudolycoriella hygida]|uniref:Uncharacterized protein n=1 Tax=Pseudolycoriella hygida TaxID=35572 RepID=A0A9Q0S2R6_9DIPT|nr:hypothetical protein Bhyg_07415 [Pseudolycoriella hygida]
MRNIASTVRRTWHQITPETYEIHESNILHKSKDYHYNAGFHRRRRKYKKILGKFDAEYQEDRQQGGGDEPSQKNSDFMKFLEWRMKWFGRATNAYMQKPVTNIKFDKFRSTQKIMSKMAAEIVGVKDVHNLSPSTVVPKILFGSSSNIYTGHIADF